MSLDGNHISEGACYQRHDVRDMAAISLLRVAHKMFSDATIVKNLDKLEDCIIHRGFDIGEFHSLLKDFDPPFLDAFRIATCFENMFKAELLCCGYVVHKINNRKHPQLHGIQLQRPIKLSEIKAIEGAAWKRRGKVQITSLNKMTLTLAQLINKNSRYKNSLRLSNACIDAIDTIRRHRNTVHFLVNDIGHYNKKVVGSYIYLRTFLNKRLINRYNKIVQRWEHLRTNAEFQLYEI